MLEVGVSLGRDLQPRVGRQEDAAGALDRRGDRDLECLALLFPPAFFMGFPFALGMGVLSKLRRERFFVWAWGINGAFSVVGSVAVPIIAVLFGLKAVLLLAAALYALALPAFVRFARPEGSAA